MYTRDVMTINKVNYLVGRILRGTVKVGDTMSRKSVCAKSSLPDVSTTVVKILKDRQPVNQATKGETVAVGVADKGLIYSYYGLAGTSFETSGRVTAKIYFLTKEEGNTYVDNILNDTYITANFPVLHEDAQSVGKIRFDGTFQQGTSKDVTILSFATLPTGWAPYRKGLAFNLVKDSLKNIYAIGVITGTTPPCD